LRRLCRLTWGLLRPWTITCSRPLRLLTTPAMKSKKKSGRGGQSLKIERTSYKSNSSR
jgi:hypothetical protein